MYLDTPEPFVQFFNTFLTISQSKNGKVEGTAGVEALVCGMVCLLRVNVHISMQGVSGMVYTLSPATENRPMHTKVGMYIT